MLLTGCVSNVKTIWAEATASFPPDKHIKAYNNMQLQDFHSTKRTKRKVYYWTARIKLG